MAKIVLRTNIANKNFTIEHKVLNTPLANTKVELVISPKSGYTIKANNFTTGYPPQEIKSIRYVDYGSKVKAVVTFVSTMANLKRNINISLPISGVATVLKDNFILVEACAGDDDINVISNSYSSYLSTVGASNETFHDCGDDRVSDIKTYSVKNTLCTKILVLNKKFATPENHYFPKEPTYKITGNSNRYTVVSKLRRDKNNRIIYKNFDIYYTSPCESITIDNRDTICFSAKSATILDKNLEEVRSLRDKEATKQEDYKIYSFNTGETLTAKGGVKKIEIKGVPGTPFRIIAQNNAKQTYNFKTSVFEAGGGMLSGVIPSARANASYGTYTTAIKVKRASATDTISTKLVTDNLIDHATLDAAAELSKSTGSNRIVPATKLTFTVASTGFVIPSDSPIVIGPGRYQESSELESSFKISIYAADQTKSIRIIRQPLHDISAIYYNWDSAYGSDTEKLYNSAGKEIKTDWNVSGDGATPNNTEAKYIINATAVGKGEVVLNDIYGDSYQYINLKVTISGTIFGTADVTPELDLLNFLTLV